MISSLFNKTCQILQRQEPQYDTNNDRWNEFQYSLGKEISCLFIDKLGKVIKDSRGEDIQISGYIYLDETITEIDKILMEGYEYEIIGGGVSYNEDIITGENEYYRLTVIRRRLYSEGKIAVS
jgi:hypothetical protein